MRKLAIFGSIATLLLCLAGAPALAGDSDSGRRHWKHKKHRPASQPIPEPSAAVLFGLGAAGAAWAAKRRQR